MNHYLLMGLAFFSTLHVHQHFLFTSSFLQLRKERNSKIEWLSNGAEIGMCPVWFHGDNEKNNNNIHGWCRHAEKRAKFSSSGVIQENGISDVSYRITQGSVTLLTLDSNWVFPLGSYTTTLWAKLSMRSCLVKREESLTDTFSLVGRKCYVLGEQCGTCPPAYTHTHTHTQILNPQASFNNSRNKSYDKNQIA